MQLLTRGNFGEKGESPLIVVVGADFKLYTQALNSDSERCFKYQRYLNPRP